MAADAEVAVDYDDAIDITFGQSACRADADALGLGAVHAGEGVEDPCDIRELARGLLDDASACRAPGGDAMPLFAGDLAGIAFDAPVRVRVNQ